ncbi:hypothetical protein nbrc107697_34160 [Gordonia crocea]|uniref:Uncharacterized protein n=1 Tax=Gordonia crocea TaxID=589162 RepID=A0A7I9V1R0_9ACTN|nr:hypothetical protein nbrc107697_34160 [Gordonia crocea]
MRGHRDWLPKRGHSSVDPAHPVDRDLLDQRFADELGVGDSFLISHDPTSYGLVMRITFDYNDTECRNTTGLRKT